MKYHLAIDIGASSGRHIVGWVENEKIQLKEVYRFDNTQITRNGHECWDLDALARHVVAGLKAAKEAGYQPETVGIDTWGVDFVLVDAAGKRVSDAVAYRDARTEGMPAKLDATLPFSDLYRHCGIQKVPYNTIYQLVALQAENPHAFDNAERLLMVPDYLNFILTGVQANEYTDASTTSLLNAAAKDWDFDIIDRLGLPRKIFKPLTMPGATLGGFAPGVAAEVGYDAHVVLPACHDTGSAYLAVPARDDKAVYLSSGTWSLLGVENDRPITGKAALGANFTNEGGAWGRYRFLKNIMGLWMIQSIRRELNGTAYVEGKGRDETIEALKALADYEKGKKYSFADLEMAARGATETPVVVNANDARFLNPPSMIAAILAATEEEGQSPKTVGALMQCVYKSLAVCYAAEIANLSEITGKTYTSLNIVGGGSQDRYLNALTAEETGLEVFAGPVEGTAIGNLIVQMIASGEFTDITQARKAIQK